MKSKEKYVAFLRGINVGGHHKVPMIDLRAELEKINLKNSITILNSGNVLFESDEKNLENKISEHLEEKFGFHIPVIINEIIMTVTFIPEFVFRECNLYERPDSTFRIRINSVSHSLV